MCLYYYLVVMVSGDDLRTRVLARVDYIRSYGVSKDSVREAYRPIVVAEKRRQRKRILSDLKSVGKFFASGSDVVPEKVDPVLVLVEKPWQARLFRLAQYSWSLPYSRGYGRRLRFLVLDRFNGKLIGLLGLQSPPLTFPARDSLFSYPDGFKVGLVNQTMDAFVLGAIPPYSFLLGGKLLALSVLSNEVQDAYRERYGDGLVAVSTVSAFGRSSIYNRLNFLGEKVVLPLGMTSGYGVFHLNGLVAELRDYLSSNGYAVRSGFEGGSKPVWSDVATAVRVLGLSSDLVLYHGIRREVFMFPLISNIEGFFNDLAKPIFVRRSFQDIAAWWQQRWELPRSIRNSDWFTWLSDDMYQRVLEGLDNVNE